MSDIEIKLAARIIRIESVLRAAKLHEPSCPANHDCYRDHPEAGVYHYPQPCSCWLTENA